jgi:hypothetical protein
VNTLYDFNNVFNQSTDVVTCLPVGQANKNAARLDSTTYCDGGINYAGDFDFNSDPSSYSIHLIIPSSEDSFVPAYATYRRCGFRINTAVNFGTCSSIQKGPAKLYEMRRFCPCDAPVIPSSCPTPKA